MSIKDRIRAIPMKSLNIGTIGLGWNVIDAAGLPQACSIIRLINASKSDLSISYDEVDAHDYLNQGASMYLFLQMNRQHHSKVCRMAKGTKIYASGAASAGFLYVVGYY
jgi:hypothetical protein